MFMSDVETALLGIAAKQSVQIAGVTLDLFLREWGANEGEYDVVSGYAAKSLRLVSWLTSMPILHDPTRGARIAAAAVKTMSLCFFVVPLAKVDTIRKAILPLRDVTTLLCIIVSKQYSCRCTFTQALVHAFGPMIVTDYDLESVMYNSYWHLFCDVPGTFKSRTKLRRERKKDWCVIEVPDWQYALPQDSLEQLEPMYLDPSWTSGDANALETTADQPQDDQLVREVGSRCAVL